MIVYVLSCLFLIASIFILVYFSTKKLRISEMVESTDLVDVVSIERPTRKTKRTHRTHKSEKVNIQAESGERFAIVNKHIENKKEVPSELTENLITLPLLSDVPFETIEEISNKPKVKQKRTYRKRAKNKVEIDDSLNIVLDNKHEMVKFEMPSNETKKSIFNVSFSDIKHCVITQYHADNTSAYSRQIISEDDFLEVLSKIRRYSSQFVSGYRFSIMYDGVEEIFNLTTTIS